MKKKVLYGVTLALLGASMVSLQSCKDDLSDLEHRMDYELNGSPNSLKELWNKCFGNVDPNANPKSLAERIQALEDFVDGLNKLNEKYPEEGFLDLFGQVMDEIDELKNSGVGTPGKDGQDGKDGKDLYDGHN